MKQGAIVTVCHPGSMFDGAQGEVVGSLITKGQEVLQVKFGPEHEHLASYLGPGQRAVVEFLSPELKQDADWSPMNKAKMIFGDRFMQVMSYKHQFTPGQPCRHKDCQRLVTKRGLVNIWGTVMEIDVCDEHYEQYHGHCLDDFPCK